MSVENLKTQSEVFFRSLYSINARLIYFLFYPLDSHTHVAYLIELGFSPVEIAERLGHESISVTYTYSHLYPSKQKSLADKLNTDRKKALEQKKEDGEDE